MYDSIAIQFLLFLLSCDFLLRLCWTFECKITKDGFSKQSRQKMYLNGKKWSRNTKWAQNPVKSECTTGCLILNCKILNGSEGQKDQQFFAIMEPSGFMSWSGKLSFINQFSKKWHLLASKASNRKGAGVEDFTVIKVFEFGFILMFWKRYCFGRIMKYQIEI